MPLHLRELHFNLGGVLHQQGRHEEASEHYRRSIHFSQGLEPTGDRTLAQAHHSLGIALSHQGQWEPAIDCYHAALTLQPDNGAVYISLGIALSHCQRLEEAIVACRAAVLRLPDAWMSHYYLGKALQVVGNHALAVESFQRSHRLEPSEPLVLNDLLVSLIELSRWDEMTHALRAIVRLPEIDRVLREYQTWAAAQQGEDEVTQARKQCAKFLRAVHQGTDWHAPLAQMLWHWGNVLMSHGREQVLNQAETFYQQAIALQPQAVDYAGALVQCLARQGRTTAATVAAHWGLTRAPGNSVLLDCLTAGLDDSAGQVSLLPNSQAQRRCDGLNCMPCLRQIYQGFEPTHLGRGVFRVGRAVNLELGDDTTLLETGPTTGTFANGRAWVAPQQDPWQACHTIAVFDEDGSLQPKFCREYPAQLPVCQQSHIPAAPVDLPSAHRVTGSAVLLSGLSGHVYFHWMVDILPRVAALRSSHTGQIDWFIVNSMQKRFQRETLQKLGVPLERVIESDRYPHIQADRLIVPTFAAPLGWPTKPTIEMLRQQFLGDPAPAVDYPKRIYISRAGARYRRVVNEAAVVEQLQTLGVVPIDLEQLSVAEQTALFAQATLIVAPHGSGLTNLVFCQPGATVVELLSSNYVRHYYWPISQHCQLNHYTVVSPGLPCFSLRQWMYLNPLAEDIWVNQDALHNALRFALKATPSRPANPASMKVSSTSAPALSLQR